ncbi:MAG: tetratricopeptide repeat protein [bacterium]
MKSKPKEKSVPAINWEYMYNYILLAVLAVTIFLTAVLPDMKIARYKLEALEIGVFALFFILLIRFVIFGKIELKKLSLNIPMLAYFLGFLMFYFIVPNKSIAIQELRRMLLCCGIFFFTAHIFNNDKERYFILFAWFFSTLLVSLYGIMQYFGGIHSTVFIFIWYFLWALVLIYGLKLNIKKHKIAFSAFLIISIAIHILIAAFNIDQIEVPKMDRVMSTFGNPIFFAAFLIVVLPSIFSCLYIFKHWLLRLFLTAVALAVLIAIYYSKTRAAWIAAVFGLISWFLLVESNQNWIWIKGLYKRKWVVLGGIAGIIVIHLVLFAGNSAYKKSVGNTVNYFLQIAHRQQAHPLIWRDSLRMWRANPLIGVGLGSFHVYFPEFASDELKSIWPQGKFIVNDAHNEYIQILAEIGVTGFSIFILLLCAYVLQIKRLWMQKIGNRNILISGLFAGSAALMLQNFFSVDMRFVISSASLFFAAGMASSWEERRWEFYLKKDVVIRALLLGIICVVGFYSFKELVKPYIAYRELKKQKSFFDEKVLDPAKTIGDLQKLAEEFPTESKIFERLGWVYSKEKMWNKAIESYLKSIELDPNLMSAYNNLGNIHYKINRLDKAIEFYKKAISIDPKSFDAYLNCGTAYYQKGMLKEAAEEFEKVLKMDPNNYKAISMLKRMTE